MTEKSRQFHWTILWVALGVVALDQLTKALVLHFVPLDDEKIIIGGFFKIVHWGNTGAAWSLFYGKNGTLAIVALAALLVLFFCRQHFEIHTVPGRLALGLIFGGI